MKYTYSLEERDYLTHQLFVASISKPAIKRRRNARIMVTLAFLMLAFLMELNSNEFLRNYFLGFSLLIFMLYPWYSRWRYKKHYQKHVNEHFAKSYGKGSSVEFQNEHLFLQDGYLSESKISHSQIESLVEIPEHFLVRLINGHSLILPKAKIEPLSQLRSELTALGSKLGLVLNDQTNWKWK